MIQVNYLSLKYDWAYVLRIRDLSLHGKPFQETFCQNYFYRGLYIDGSMCGVMPVEFNCHTVGINNLDMYGQAAGNVAETNWRTLVVGDLAMYGLMPGPAASNVTEANCPTLVVGDLSSANCPTLVVQDSNTTLGVGRRPSAACPTLVV